VDINDNTALIIGLTVGLFTAIVIGSLIGYYLYRNHVRWRLFVKRPLSVNEVVHDETNFNSAYPVTRVYYKDK